VRVAYVVARFPLVSQTFIVRELDAVAAQPGLELELFSLYPPHGPKVVHPAARPWLARLHSGTDVRAGFSALAWWLRRRPLRVLATVATVARAHARRPGVLARALLTLLPAAAHARRMDELRIDHVHAHFASFPALAAWVVGRLTGVPYSFTSHAHDLFVHQLFLARKVRDARFLVTISEFNRRFLAQVAGAPPIHVVHAGIESGRYPARPRDLSGERRLRAVCVATLQEKKGHAVLLDALAGEPRLARLDVELVGDGELRPPLEARVRRLGLENRVRFLGALPQEQVTERLEQADLFVLPSIVARSGQMEGIPVALMEALACELPVVATSLSGIPELVRDGETGVLATPGSPESLRDALQRTLADPEGSARRAAAGRRLVAAEYDLDVSARTLAELFRTGGGRGHSG
jgi:colanic acid/amylovoran biosynthesis glycosyltransferase